jgi:hypothetical protein
MRPIARKTFPRKSIHTEISPLRFAPVEMTKGKTVLPERVVAEWKPLCITLGGLKPILFSNYSLWKHRLPLCHLDRSEAQWRDLRFSGPLVEMFFDRVKRMLCLGNAPITAACQSLPDIHSGSRSCRRSPGYAPTTTFPGHRDIYPVRLRLSGKMQLW